MTETKNVRLLMLMVGWHQPNPAKPELQPVLRLVTQADLDAGKLPQGREMVFSAKAGRNFKHVGWVYSVEAKDEKGESIYATTARPAAQWPNQDEAAKWGALAKATQRAAEAIRVAEKHDAFLERLDPIRDAMRQARGIHRTQLLAAVVEYISQ